uniref:Mediator of RNA polymerase II transcription subunit 24 n=1 Tax=Pan troglodytes TaxID=9598 RepID=G2HJX4_PANTR|nr:thyroid hormone receptor-associated protein complex 100 kDa component [Pan troglodytes]
MKVVNLKQAILQAWRERWSDYQWAINMKKFFPKGATWDILNLADALLEQAMIGPSPNPLILSYLKYAISSQMVSYSSVLTAISKFDDFSRDLCVQALLDIMDMFCDRLSCHGKAEECTGVDTMPYWNLLPPKRPIKEVLTDIFAKVLEKGWVDSRSIHIFDTLLHMGGVYWFCNNLIKELLKETRKEHTLRAVELLYSIFCLDMQQVTLVLLGHILPGLLTDSSKWHSLMDPPGTALAKLAVWCALSSYSSHKGQASTRQKKRHREDIEDYISLFPLDDVQPSKLMRLLSSNEDDANILSSPNRSMSSSLSASQLHTVNMRDPLNRVLANLFLLISSILGSRTAGPHTQFVQWFMEECVDCLEQGGRGSVLQFMPFTTVPELVKVSAMSSPKVVLAITDLSLPLGRQVAAKAIAAL